MRRTINCPVSQVLNLLIFKLTFCAFCYFKFESTFHIFLIHFYLLLSPELCNWYLFAPHFLNVLVNNVVLVDISFLPALDFGSLSRLNVGFFNHNAN